MAATEQTEFEEVVHIKPSGEDETITPEETDAAEENNEDEEVEDDTDTSKPDEIVKTKKTAPAEEGESSEDEEVAPVEGETPAERGLRKQVEELRGKLRKERTDEIVKDVTTVSAARTKELSEEDKAVIGKFKPNEIAALREVIPVLAKEAGYIREDQLAGQSYAEKAQDQLNAFLDKHPEYLPENDKEGTLWGSFKSEYELYKQPTNPRDFSKIFERIHKDVFGIKPAGALPKVNAQREKASVASHTGASSAARPSAAKPSKASAAQFRTDALKGFSAEEIEEMFG